ANPRARHRRALLLVEGVELFCRLEDFPSPGEASWRHESVACPEGALRPVVASDHDDASEQMAKLTLGENDAPLSRLSLPYAGIETAVGAAKQVIRRLHRVTRENAVSRWAVALRQWQRVLEADDCGHGFGGRFGGHRLFSSLSKLVGHPVSAR